MTESSKPQTQYLKDYKAPDFLIDHTELTLDLQPLTTKVSALLTLNRSGDKNAPLVLDGINLRLLSLSIDTVSYTHLTLPTKA